ncbi:terminal nucleotidyltransferase 5C-like [Menidia menidia]
MELQTEKRFHNLTLQQVQALDKVLTEVIPIHGRGNFPTLQVRAKDIIRVVKDRLVERDIQVKDIRLNGATASYVLVRDNGLGYRDLDIIFGVELPRQEDFQVIKEVVLGSLRDLLPCGVNRRKITCLTMKEAYVQKMVKVYNEHDRWSLILLSNNRAKTVGLRFVSSLRRQFEFSVDSFQIILDRMLESYWETDRKQHGKFVVSKRQGSEGNKGQEQRSNPGGADEETKKDLSLAKPRAEAPFQEETVSVPEKQLPQEEIQLVDGKQKAEPELEPEVITPRQPEEEEEEGPEDVPPVDASEVLEEKFPPEFPSVESSETTFPDAGGPMLTCLNQQSNEDQRETQVSQFLLPVADTEKLALQEMAHGKENTHSEVDAVTHGTPTSQESRLEFSFPPPAKKTCSTSQDIVPDFCPSPKLQRKMSRKKLISKPEKWSLLTDLSDLTTQFFPPIEIPKPLQPKPLLLDNSQVQSPENPEGADACSRAEDAGCCESVEQTVKPKHSKKPPDLGPRTLAGLPDTSGPPVDEQMPEPVDQNGPSSWGEHAILVEAECMFGDFHQAMEHLHRRLIATRNPEEIRGGGLLKYSDLLVRNFRPASETEIKSLERYMCSRFFIDFPDLGEQQRKIEAYLLGHFSGSEEASKYDFLMTLRRVIDESTVCLMGHERRQTLNMITVLALRVLGEQNAIPNTANVTCFYQPAPYMAEPIYNSYYIAQPQLVYHPYPLQVHMQTGLV